MRSRVNSKRDAILCIRSVPLDFKFIDSSSSNPTGWCLFTYLGRYLVAARAAPTSGRLHLLYSKTGKYAVRDGEAAERCHPSIWLLNQVP